MHLGPTIVLNYNNIYLKSRYFLFYEMRKFCFCAILSIGLMDVRTYKNKFNVRKLINIVSKYRVEAMVQ